MGGLVKTAAQILADMDPEQRGGDGNDEYLWAGPVVPLTDRQQAVLAAIVGWMAEHAGAPPSQHELSAILRLDRRAAARHVMTLAHKAYLTVTPNKIRGIRLAESIVGGHRYVPSALHGLTGYRVFGCRCTTCRKAHDEAQPRDRAERVA